MASHIGTAWHEIVPGHEDDISFWFRVTDVMLEAGIDILGATDDEVRHSAAVVELQLKREDMRSEKFLDMLDLYVDWTNTRPEAVTLAAAA